MSSNKPFLEFSVSVVIPAYNEAARIGRAIQSVLDQTFPVNEIIVIDDGSSDDTSEVVAKYNDVVCIRQSNQGHSAARNTGIRYANSEWIAFLDADDEWFPTHIEMAWTIYQKHPEITWYCAAFERRSEDGTLDYRMQLDNLLCKNDIIENYFFAQAKKSFSNASAMLVRKSVFDDVGLFNVEINRNGEDLDMWFRIATRHPQIAYSNFPACIYWAKPGSITSDGVINVPRFLDRIETTQISSNQLGGPTRESNYLIQNWVIMAIKYAIKEQDKQSLGAITKKYNHLLPRGWLLIAWLFQNNLPLYLIKKALLIRRMILA